MYRNKLFLNSPLQKQRNFPAQPESYAATACIAHKSLRICEQCRLGRNLQSLPNAEIPRRRANGDLVFSRIRPPVTGSRIEVSKGQPIEPERNLLGFAWR